MNRNEELTAERLDLIRVAREQCETYSREMVRHSRRLEEADVSGDTKNYLQQRRLLARRELALLVDQLVREQTEMLDEAERDLRAQAHEEENRLRREKASASWD